MRVFIAIEPPRRVQQALERDAGGIRAGFAHGSFTRRENYHLTLCFLGEIAPERLPSVVEAMEAVSSPPPVLTVGALGRFSSRPGATIYRSVQSDSTLFHLQRELCRELARRGFALEERAYTPHFTVARRAVLREGAALDALSARGEPLSFAARSMTLFRSDLTEGKRVYTPLHRCFFT